VIGLEVDPFSAPGKFWRGNLHTHSTRSDGVLDPDEVARCYQLEEYDFLVMTDHFVGLFDYPLTNIQYSENENFRRLAGQKRVSKNQNDRPTGRNSLLNGHLF